MLTGTAWSRGAEYDEQYTLFLTAGTPRPAWPDTAFPAGLVQTIQSQKTDLATIAADLRRTDVHPPFYFWTAALWRRVAGSSLFNARLLSVGFSLTALALVGLVARQAAVSPALAMLLTLGSYGFVYTGSVARGFALAQMLNLAGVCCILAARRGRRHSLAAGALFGAAAASNYLAVFVGASVIMMVRRPRLHAIAAVLALVPFLALDVWYFVAQHSSRNGQFPPFSLADSLIRIGQYTAANVFGGLPLYLPDAARLAVTCGVAALAVALAGLVIVRWRQIGSLPGRHTMLAAALSPTVGLLALGMVFNNTPIELRYLSFATPFLAVLAAGALGPVRPEGFGLETESPWRPGGLPPGCRSRPAGVDVHLPGPLPISNMPWSIVGAVGSSPQPSDAGSNLPAGSTDHPPRPGLRSAIWRYPPLIIQAIVLGVQALAIAGLILRPETMQPARATAEAAAPLARNGAVLLPYGNDGVGIVGAFAGESPPDLPLIAIRSGESVLGIRRRIAGYQRVVVATVAQDRDSRAAVPLMLAALKTSCWKPLATGAHVVVYERRCDGEPAIPPPVPGQPVGSSP